MGLVLESGRPPPAPCEVVRCGVDIVVSSFVGLCERGQG